MPAMSCVIVLCPLAVEADAVRSALGGRASVVVTGPGSAVVQAAQRAAGETPALLVLAGLCGGLAATSSAPRIGSVLSMSGQRWTAPVIAPVEPEERAVSAHAQTSPLAPAPRPRRLYDPPEIGQPADGRVTLLGVDRVVHTPRAKRALGERTGAEIVDTEAHYFAAACAGLGLRWAVVRGVSDGPDEALPAGIETWVAPDGRTRMSAVAMACMTRPWVLPALLRLRANTRRALAAMCGRLIALVDDELRTGAAQRAEPSNCGVA